MKQLLLTGLLLLAVGGLRVDAQSNVSDDIYFNSADIEKQKQEDRQQTPARYSRDNEGYNNPNGYNNNNDGYQSYNRSYGNDGYDNSYDNYDDDYYYSTNLRRFNQPFYNMGFYSSFYNPYWYDPYWYDPYWGWSAWNRPYYSMSFGYGPYWSSYWGWYSWYGYPSYYSYYNYPYYGSSFCGNPYYNGYWNGYYAGLYNNNYGSYKQVTYGPRNSSNIALNTNIRNTTSGQKPSTQISPRQRISNDASMTSPMRNNNVNVDRAQQMDARRNNDLRSGGSFRNEDRPSRQQFSRDDNYSPRADRYDGMNDANVRMQPAPDRNDYRQPQYSAPRQEPMRYEQQPMQQQRNFDAPSHYQRSEPSFQQQRMESPRMSSPSQRNMGGGFSSGGGGARMNSGGGFGGRR